MAINKVHKYAQLRNLWRMSQQLDEPIRAYVAYQTSTADMFATTVKCMCNLDVSYRDNVIQQLVIHGINDNEIRITVLSRNTNGELTTLQKLVDCIQAEGARKNESHDLITSEDYQVNGLKKSSYQKDKGKCTHCGNIHHSKSNGLEDRKNTVKHMVPFVINVANVGITLQFVCKKKKQINLYS